MGLWPPLTCRCSIIINKISDLTEQLLRTFKLAFFHVSAEIIMFENLVCSHKVKYPDCRPLSSCFYIYIERYNIIKGIYNIPFPKPCFKKEKDIFLVFLYQIAALCCPTPSL